MNGVLTLKVHAGDMVDTACSIETKIVEARH